MPLELPVLFRQGFSSPSSYLVEVYNGSLDATRSKRRFDMVGPGEIAVWGARRVKNVATTSWTVSVTSGQTAVLTRNAAVGPDGQMTAMRLTMARATSGATVYTWAGIGMGGSALPTNMPFVTAITMRSANGTPSRVLFGGAQGAYGAVVTVDDQWRRFGFAGFLNNGGNLYCRVLLYDAADLSTDVLIAMDDDNCPQLELGPLLPGEPTHPARDYGWGTAGVQWFATGYTSSIHATSRTVTYDPAPPAIPDIEGIRPMPPYTMPMLHTLTNLTGSGSTWSGAPYCSASVSSLAGPINGAPPVHLVELDPSTSTLHRISLNMGVPASSYVWGAAIVRPGSRFLFQLQIHNGSDGNLTYATYNASSSSIAIVTAGVAGIRPLDDDWVLAWIASNSYSTNAGSALYLTLVNSAGANVYVASPGLGLHIAWVGGGHGRVPVIIPTTGSAVSILADANQLPTSTPATGRWSCLIEFFTSSPALRFVAGSFYTTNPRLAAADGSWNNSIGMLGPDFEEFFLQDHNFVSLLTSGAGIVPHAINRVAVVVDPPFTSIYSNGRLVAQASYYIGEPFSRVGYAVSHVYGAHGIRAYRVWRDFAMPGVMADYLTASRAV